MNQVEHVDLAAVAMADRELVEDILDVLDSSARTGHVSVGELVESFGRRGSGALLILPALLELSPIGGVPGVPTLLALFVVLIAAQILMGREHIWLPDFVSRRALPADKLALGVAKLRPAAKWLDRWFRGRMEALTERGFVRAAALACMLLMITVPPLELVPFASSAPMLAVIAFGLALLVHDGALMVLASIMSVSALAFAVRLI